MSQQPVSGPHLTIKQNNQQNNNFDLIQQKINNSVNPKNQTMNT